MWYFVCICKILAFLLLQVKTCHGIILSNEEQTKPSYTSGIKTTHSKNPNTIQTHYNYSKVFVNNNPDGHLHYTLSQTENIQRVYPIYNAHAYGGNRESQSQQRINNINVARPEHFASLITGNKSNRTIYKRKIQVTNIEVYEKCPEGATGQFVYNLNCNQFLNCWKGRGQPQTCSPGTLFNPKTLECDYPEKVDCVTGPRENTLEGISFQKSTAQVLCPKEFSGLIPNYTDCSKFINCNNGQQNPINCPPGTLFDVNQNLCDFSHKATCFNGYSNNPKGLYREVTDQGTHYYHGFEENQYGIAKTQPLGALGLNSFSQGYGGSSHNQHPINQLNQSNYGTSSQPKINLQLDFGPDQTNDNSQFYSKTYCLPGSRNCNSNVGYHTNLQNNTDLNICNPRTQNCNNFQKCNEYNNYCGHSQNTNQGYTSRLDQINYSKICNINDPNCHKNENANTDVPPKCPPNFQGLVKHPTDCAKFLNCANGATFIQNCSPGTLFSPTLGVCDFPYRVQCSNTANPHATTTTTKPQRQVTSVYSTQSYRGQANNNQVPWPYSQGHHSEYNQNLNQGGYNQHQGTNNQATMYYNQGQGNYFVTPSYGPTNYNHSYDDHNHRRSQGYNFQQNENAYNQRQSSSSRSVWPPPYPSTDVNADYVFEYEDGELVTLAPENVIYLDRKNVSVCSTSDFYCTANSCISITMVCNGHRDCENGRDELYCEHYLGKFHSNKNHRLGILEKQIWINVTLTTCAILCVETKHFHCRSFNYRKKDKTCFIIDSNIGLSGALQKESVYDYYELTSASINCTNQYKCQNGRCIAQDDVCDGVDDCGNREDEKGCKPKDFGYHIKLAGSINDYEGRVEITAFGRNGFICDDNFGILDANVICRELGFALGATEFKGNSYYAKEFKENSTNYLIDDLDCFGNETTLLDCGFSGWGVHNCISGEVAGVVCKTPQQKCSKEYWKCDSDDECIPLSFVCDGLFDCTDSSDEGAQHCEAPVEMRLVNGTNNKEGRIEIKHHGIWGTVCDDDFNDDAGKVVCAYFGFRGLIAVKKDAYFGRGDGPIWLDQVSCYGNETALIKCTHWNWGEHNCDHGEDVGVICSNDYRVIERHSKVTTRYESSTKLPLSTGSVSCGFRKDNQFLQNDLIHARVVSGSMAKKGDYPWQAALRVRGKGNPVHWCGAVVISKTWVLTAAHCLQGYAKGAYIIVAGEYNTDEDEGTEQQKYIEEYFIHQDFRKGHKMNNDIALIKLKNEGFILNDDIQPICLPDANADYERELNCTISGFGSVKSGTSAYSHNMRAAWIPVHNSNTCKMPHVYGTAITEGMICAGFLDGGVDSCDGDSGGPLACLDDGLFTLYGLTSWGQHCGYANKPGVYVKISHYRRWMDDIMSKH